MPELPEVENARATLQRFLERRVLEGVRVESARPLEGSAAALRRRVTGAKVGRAQRRGKQAFLPLTDAAGERFGLALHLGMTGRIAVTRPRARRPRFARLSLRPEGGGAVVHLCDARRFGRIALVEASRIGQLPEAAALGPDPILDDWSVETLREALLGTGRAVKDVLMDQSRIAGIGNIYAAEALWRARIDPLRPADELDDSELASLAPALREVLADSLAGFRTLLDAQTRRFRAGDPKAFDGPIYMSEGGANPFAVYGRSGSDCPRCEGRVDVVTIAGRSSYFCPGCQT